MSAQDEQSSAKASITSWSPWKGSSATPASAVPNKGKEPEQKPVIQPQKAKDHAVTHHHRLSLKRYPRDCPPTHVQWFHAVDAPKRRPNLANEAKTPEKPAPAPKKYAAFSKKDSKALEAAYQKLVEKGDVFDRHALLQRGSTSVQHEDTQAKPDSRPNKSLSEGGTVSGQIKVPVNEDYLFDVDVEKRELGPAYWLGPIYNVRRGTWFYQESSVQKPCDENLAAQLEEGYLKTKAWTLSSTPTRSRSVSQARTRPKSWAPESAASATSTGRTTPTTSELDSNNDTNKSDASGSVAEQDSRPDNTYRLFGAHMNSVVTYQDATTAWLSTDDFVSRMNYNMYQRFGGGGHFAGVKLTRGFVDPVKKVENKDAKTDPSKPSLATSDDQEPQSSENQRPSEDQPSSPSESRRQTLERQMSYLLEDPQSQDPAKHDEDQRLRDEREIEDDYREADGDDQGREIEHLILVTHGIGQRLGLRLDSVNFVHDVNTFRKTLKAVYSDSPDLRALNAELDSASKTNCRVQVLPICWRHLLDFPKQSLKHNRAEHDLADSGFGEEEDYPSLADISIEGVPAVRGLITDLALDILLYQSPAYKDHISRIVLEECNRIYHLFILRNPNFDGKVSMIGHSLGSAIMFDILCRQEKPEAMSHRRKPHPMKLEFEVEDFYALGSPIGLFEMLRGRAIAARDLPPSKRAFGGGLDDPMFDAHVSQTRRAASTLGAAPIPTSDIQIASPRCEQVFNIFHPTDPIAYRIEPLISPAMASIKPQPLPYTKRGIFGAPVGQGLTGIGARVGQSVSSLWTSMSSGLASSLLTRGLGYTGEDPARLAAETSKDTKSNAPLSLSAGTNIAGGVAPRPLKPVAAQALETSNKQAQLASDALAAGAKGQHPPTLIDQEIETLSSGFEKRRHSLTSDSQTRDLGVSNAADLAEIEERGRRLKREEEKVRRLNGNGRVDYAIQEGAFDINLLAAIASHLNYWGDEDVCHFMISQLLSRSNASEPSNSRTRSASNKPAA